MIVQEALDAIRTHRRRLDDMGEVGVMDRPSRERLFATSEALRRAEADLEEFLDREEAVEVVDEEAAMSLATAAHPMPPPDPYLRMQCFQSVAGGDGGSDAQLERAKALFAWVSGAS